MAALVPVPKCRNHIIRVAQEYVNKQKTGFFVRVRILPKKTLQLYLSHLVCIYPANLLAAFCYFLKFLLKISPVILETLERIGMCVLVLCSNYSNGHKLLGNASSAVNHVMFTGTKMAEML